MPKKSLNQPTMLVSGIPTPWPHARKWLFLVLGTFASLCMLCLVSVGLVAPHWVSPKQLLSFGAKGTSPGQLDHPSYISVDGQGNIYIADWGDGRINVFDSSGKFLRLITVGDQTIILGMAVAPIGTLYISYDGVIHRIDTSDNDTELKYTDAKGDLVADISGVALGADGNLAAADNRGDVLRFDTDGQASLILERAFNLPSFSSRNELEPNGAPVLSYDVRANSADKNISVAVDGSGNIYAIGWTLGVVLKTDANGNSLSKFGQWANVPGGWERGRFDFPDGIAVDSHGRIYVGDSSGVQVFSPQEKYLYSIRVPDGVDALALDAQDNIYVVTTLYDHQLGDLTHKVIKLAALKP